MIGILWGAAWATEVAVLAQEGASIVGQVQDASGAVIPGVTVEASSPALIEKMRVAITDAAGRYAISSLRPGEYVVTFTLAGFTTVRREGIVLEGSFAAQVNAQLIVGALEETVTVSGASPVVDVQNTRTQFVASRQILDVLPSRTTQDQASLVPGVVSYNVTPGQVMPDLYTQRMFAHGSSTADQHIVFDGMNVNQMALGSGGQASSNGVNELAQAELVYDVGGLNAETADGGIQQVVIPKEGGNTFSGVWRLFGSHRSFQADNLTTELRQKIAAVSKLDFNWENNVTVGGALRRDRLWYFAALKLNQNNVLAANEFFRDGRQADSAAHVAHNATLRLTYQASPRNKVAAFGYNASQLVERFDVGAGGSGGENISPEASRRLATPVNYHGLVKWTSPVTSRFLLEAGQSFAATTFSYLFQPLCPREPTCNGPLDVQHFNASTGRRTVASTAPTTIYFSQLYNTIVTASYVTGTHAFKTGLNYLGGRDQRKNESHADINQLVFVNVNGVPTSNSVLIRNTPVTTFSELNANLGLFVQDKWTVNRLTLTPGLRFDYFNAAAPEQTAPAGRFVPERHAAPVACLPCWKDWAVRLGIAYDLFGTGKTALKASIGKFVESTGLGLATSVNPMGLQTDARSWRDLDGNGHAVDANGFPQWEEIGPSRNRNFGLPVGAVRFDPETPRSSNWMETVSVEHELRPGASVAATYYHREFFNMTTVKNLAIDPDRDYVPFTITAPADPRLPNGGSEIITQYNLNPSKLGAADLVSTYSNHNTRVYDAIEFTTSARLSSGGFIFASLTSERTKSNDCVDLRNSDPNNRRFCEQVTPFQTLFKVSAAYSLPYAIQLSGSLQVRPGLSRSANYTYNSAIAGVALTGGGSLRVNLVNPATTYYNYVKQVDMRIARTFQVGRRRLQGFVDIFNLPNVSTVLSSNETFGPNYLTPTVVAQALRFQFGGRLDF